jgi:hypothetical protein
MWSVSAITEKMNGGGKRAGFCSRHLPSACEIILHRCIMQQFDVTCYNIF